MRGLLWFVVLAGCVETATVTCESGVICPAGTLCDQAHPGGCITQEQLDACASVAPGEPCTVEFTNDGVCDQGVCLAARCGDGLLSPGEQCDGQQFASTSDDNCTDLGFYEDKPLDCSLSCTPALPEMGCGGSCGDGVLQPLQEDCDGKGTAPAGRECIDYGFGAGVLGCSGNCGPGFDQCLTFGWEETVLPKKLTHISGTSATNVWVVGNAGFVGRFDGTSWLTVDISACTTEDLTGVFALSPTEAFAYTPLELFAISASGCTKLTPPVEIFGFWASSLNDVYVGGESSLQHFTNGTWTELSAADSPVVWGSGPNDVYVGNPDAEVRHWNGVAWSSPTPIPGMGGLGAIWGSGPNDVYASGSDASAHAMIVRNTGSGFTTSVLVDEPSLVAPESFIDEGSTAGGVTVVWAQMLVGNTGITRLLRNAGAGWVDLAVPTDGSITPFIASDGTIFAVGRGSDRVVRFTGRALLPTNAVPLGTLDVQVRSGTEAYLLDAAERVYVWDGSTWTQELTGIKDLVVASSGDVLAIGLSGGIRRRTGVNSWTLVASVNNTIMGASSATDIWVRATNTTLQHFTGTLQTAVPAGLFVRDIAVVSPTVAFAVGDTGQISHWNGTSWSGVASPTTERFFGVWARTATDAYAWGGPLVHYDGTSWSLFTEQLPASVAIKNIWSTGPNDVFAATNRGLYRFDGTRWSPVEAGATFLEGMHGSGEDIFIASPNAVTHLLRTQPW